MKITYDYQSDGLHVHQSRYMTENLYIYIYILRYRVLVAAAAVTNAVVTSASKGSGNPLCRREIGRKKLAVHKRSGSHGWILRWQYSERLPGVPFLKDLLLSSSLSFSLLFSISHFLSHSPLYVSLRLSVLFSLLRPFSTREGTATLSSTTVKALVRGWGRTRENKLAFQVLLEFYWTVVALCAREEVSFFNELSLL